MGSSTGGEIDYRMLLARHGRDYWWTAGIRRISAALLGETQGWVLDAGCGPGWSLLELPPGVRGVGVDCDMSAARTALPKHMEDRYLVQADARHLPFASGSFGSAMALDLLEQEAVDADQALGDAARALTPGGRILVRVPAHPWLMGPHDRFWGGARRYSRDELASLVRGAGLTIHRLTYANSLLFPVTVLVRLLGRMGLMSSGDDLLLLPEFLNRFFLSMLLLEARWLRRHDLPVGLSLVCLAERPRGEPCPTHSR